jgi:hypothetical protein
VEISPRIFASVAYRHKIAAEPTVLSSPGFNTLVTFAKRTIALTEDEGGKTLMSSSEMLIGLPDLQERILNCQ